MYFPRVWQTFLAGFPPTTHTSSDLHAVRHKRLAALDLGIIRIAHHNARRAIAVRSDRLHPLVRHHRAHPLTQLPLRFFQPLKPVSLGFHHGIAEDAQRIRGHCSVIGVSAVQIGLHDCMPLRQIQRETVGFRLPQTRHATLGQHHQTGTGLRTPPFLRGRDQHINAQRLHVHPGTA